MASAETLIGGIVVTVVGGLILMFIDRGLPERSPIAPSLQIPPSLQESAKSATDAINELTKAREEQAKAEATAKLLKAQVEAEAEQARHDILRKQQQLDDEIQAEKQAAEQRRIQQQQAAQAQAIDRARQLKAYRAANGGCDIGEHPQCLSMGTSGNMQKLGCICIAD